MATSCSSPAAVLTTTLLLLLAVHKADCDAVLDPAITCFTDVVYPAGDYCTCRRGDVYYTMISAEVCGSFIRRTAFAAEETIKCPPGLQFHLPTCSCNFHSNNQCPRNCPGDSQQSSSGQQPQATTCMRGGNIYTLVPDTNCRSFTQSTADLPPQVHTCPPNLEFNMTLCNCV